MGAAIFVLLSIMLTEKGAGDVTRIVGQVVTGSGFLCAGIIFKEGVTVHGLTTAVTVWCCSAIGCLAAAGYFELCLISTLLVIAVNLVFKPLDDWLMNRGTQEQKK